MGLGSVVVGSNAEDDVGGSRSEVSFEDLSCLEKSDIADCRGFGAGTGDGGGEARFVLV